MVVADTHEQVAALNHAIRDALITAGRVDDEHTASAAGARIGAGDRVVTRRNDTDVDVANRDTWTVTAVHRDGTVHVCGEHGDRVLPARYVRQWVQLGYATTVHGVQGDTAAAAHLVVGEHTSAASAYVGMTRGRESNVAHLVADTVDEAREQWIAVFARDRADLGPAYAVERAAAEAAHYATHRPLEHALADLHAAWTREHDSALRLAEARHRQQSLTEIVALTHEYDAIVPALHQAYHRARQAADAALQYARQTGHDVTRHADQLAETLCRDWDAQREPARHAARTLRQGTGLFGRGRRDVHDAADHLRQWAARWQPYLPDLPTVLEQAAVVAISLDNPATIHDQLHQHARVTAEHAHPEHAAARRDLDTATAQRAHARQAWRDTRTRIDDHLAEHGTLARHPHPERLLADIHHQLTDLQAQHDAARHQLDTLLHEPALRTLTPDRIATEHDHWATTPQQEADRARALSQTRRPEPPAPPAPAPPAPITVTPQRTTHPRR